MPNEDIVNATQGVSSPVPDNWWDICTSWCGEHAAEIYIGIVVLLLLEGVKKSLEFRKNIKKRDLSLGRFLKDYYERKLSRDRPKPLGKRVITSLIKSNLSKLRENSIIFSIDKKKILTNKERFHFASNGYHFDRFLNVLPALDGDAEFFVDACEGIGDIFKDKDIDSLLYLEKHSGTDSLFCKEIARQSLFRRTKLLGLGYRNHTGRPQVIYRENESLEGQRIAIATALLLNEQPLLDLAGFVRDNGGELVGVAILFNAIYELVDIQQILGVDSVSAIHIDLRAYRANNCELCQEKNRIKKIGFCDY